MQIRLRLLGGIAVETDGEVTQLPLDRPVSLLVHLAVRGDWVSRSELALLYRPDAADDEAFTYLRKLIFRARKFGWAHALEVSSDRLRWLVDSDVADFLTASAAKSWQAAIDAYRGSFLAGGTTPDAPGLKSWQDMQREALQARWLQASVSRAEELGSVGDHGGAATLLAAVHEAEPLAEEYLQPFLRALVADGRESQALEALERFRRLLQDATGGVPLESTLTLLEAVRDPADGGTEQQGRAELPVPVTGFVGRDAELARLEQLWEQADVRMITIVGLGGSGKTRLAIEAARRYGQRWPGPVRFVPLAPVSEHPDVAAAILSAIGQQPERLDAETALVDYLRGADTLLVLDNFEHLLPAAGLLVRLLEAVPGLRLLVTSREPLEVAGERRFGLGGLGTTTADGSGSEETSAARLFMQRAIRYSPNFVATDAAVEAVAVICQLLDGLPLAIELAASWTRLLPVTELRDQLIERSLPLEAELADLPVRHRSLWNVFDYTWERLKAAERSVLIRLSVFRGGFTLDAATSAAGADLKLLLGLLDRMLVRRFEEGRFAIHELVRQYAESRGSAKELLAARVAHSEYHCSLLARLTPGLKGAEVRRSLTLVQSDITNFEAAWATAVRGNDLASLEGARQALDYYYYYRGSYDTARRVFGEAARALAKLPGPEAARLHGLLLTQIAEKEFAIGELDAATQRVSRALDILRVHGTGPDELHALVVLGNGMVRAARYQEARPHFQAVLRGALEHGEDYLEGAAHNGLANVISLAEGDVRQAIGHYRASLEAHGRVGNLEGVTGAYTNLGACSFDLEDYAEAERLWLKAVAASREIGYREREAALLSNLGSLAEMQDRLEEAAERFSRSLAIRRELGSRPGIASVLSNLARLALRQGDAGAARTYAEDSLDTSLSIGDAAGETQSRSYLVRILLQLDRLDEAATHLTKARAIAEQTSSAKDQLAVQLSTALLREARGDAEGALSAARSVVEGAAGVSEPLRAEAEALASRLGSLRA